MKCTGYILRIFTLVIVGIAISSCKSTSEKQAPTDAEVRSVVGYIPKNSELSERDGVRYLVVRGTPEQILDFLHSLSYVRTVSSFDYQAMEGKEKEEHIARFIKVSEEMDDVLIFKEKILKAGRWYDLWIYQRKKHEGLYTIEVVIEYLPEWLQ